jgi:ATP-dependent Zn protease
MLAPRRYIAKFRSLSKKGKMIMAVQFLVISMIFGTVGKSAYTKVYPNNGGSTSPPMEVAYSSFLDIIEQSGSSRTGGSVIVDNVRISPERIVYRLTKESTNAEDDRKQMVCYTNKVAASPELIDVLHKNGVPFAAAPRQRANTLAMTARTAILGFYMLILWRMYRTFSGNSGSKDTPGKLASSSSLPLASFNEIQGIDTAKTEVMELVDTLRNPGKYAILGARAPTGLLLEGKIVLKVGCVMIILVMIQKNPFLWLFL